MRAADAELLGKEVNAQFGVGQIVFYQLLHLLKKLLIYIGWCNAFYRLHHAARIFLPQPLAHGEYAVAAGFEIVDGEGLLDVGVGTYVHAFNLRYGVGLGREHHKRDVACGGVAPYAATELGSVHAWHHPVADDERHVV